jgi:peptide/nickel transport system permease protein
MIVKKMFARPSLVAGSAIVLAFLVVAIAAPIIAPPEGESPYLIPRDGLSPIPRPPGPDHPLGTMEGQGDVFYGLIWGTRLAFWVGLTITLGRVLIGVPLGLLSGYYGGLVDAFIMRITDAFMAFPIMVAAVVMLATVGRVERVATLTLILFGWMAYARLVRGNVLSEREKEYVQAARSTGAKNLRIVLRHLLPNATHGLFVLVASDVGAMVALVAVFHFMGFTGFFAGQVATDWGQMLSYSRNWIVGLPANAFEYWHTFIPASAAIVLFSAGWNLIGDGLRDVFDPYLR